MPRSAIGQAGRCPFCDLDVRLVAPRFSPKADPFDAWLCIAQGPVRQGEQMLIGGPGPIEIGKGAKHPIFLPGKLVSRSHARLVRDENGWRIEDEASINGVFINGERVQSRLLGSGDVIQVGEYVLEYVFVQPPRIEDAQAEAFESLRETAHPIAELERIRAQLIIAFNEPRRPQKGWRRRYWIYLLMLAAAPALYWWLHRPAFVPGHLYAPANELQWFRDAKFGVMITWGPSSLIGKEISWSRAATRPGEEGTGIGDVPVEQYDSLYRRFNPVHFNAAGWIELFKRAGARYVVPVAKHHDGFCMFDSRLTDYTIMHSPYGQDIIRQIADACHAKGMKLGLYYSQPDWRQTRLPDPIARTLHPLSARSGP